MSEGYILEYGRILVFEITKETNMLIHCASKRGHELDKPGNSYYIGARISKDRVFRSKGAVLEAFRVQLERMVDARRQQLESAEASLAAFNREYPLVAEKSEEERA